MNTKNRTDNAQTPSSGKRTTVKKTQQDGKAASPTSAKVFNQNAFLLRYALTIIIFLISLFFIITVTNPALCLNDEWITANQLHQLDIDHQIIFNEGKYGTVGGIVSAFFTSGFKKNMLLYSLALPISALPAVKLFGLFGDNFRLFVILIWSLCLVLIALLIEAYYPAYSKIRGMRILFPVLLLALLLFIFNILMYRQFIYSDPSAPFDVAALVLTNHIFFALTVAVIFEICQLIFKDLWMALLGTCATIACSSYIFWAGTAKDHMLTTAVFACVIYFFILYLTYGRWRDATCSFICSGLLIWVRPEVGLFVTIFTGLFFCAPLIWQAIKKGTTVSYALKSCIPIAGVFIGSIPFFINNLLTSNSWLIPSLYRSWFLSRELPSGPQPLSEVLAQIPTEELNLSGTLLKKWDMFTSSMFKGLSLDSIIQGFSGIQIFSENGNIGFLILCSIILLALVAFILWNKRIMAVIKNQRVIFLFIILIMLTAGFIYLSGLYSVNLFETLSGTGRIITDMMFKEFSFDNFIQGLFSALIFPKNGNIGFLILCPIILLALIAFILWNKRIMAVIKNQRVIFLFLFLMIFAGVFSYLFTLNSLSIDKGMTPDMRLLSPAYLPCGILSIWVLSKTPFMKKPKDLVTYGITGAIVIVPLLFLAMIIVNSFVSVFNGYFKFFEYIILCGIILCLGLMFIYRFYQKESRLIPQAITYLLVILLITVFAFQILLVIFGQILKINGYPLWIPLVEYGYNEIFQFSP